MKRVLRILLAAALFLAPIVTRYLAYYDPLTTYQPQVTRPDFTALQLPEPPTPSASLPAVVQPVNAGKVVLFDAAHSNQYAPNEIEPLVTALNARGGRVEFDDGNRPLAAKLKYASAYVIFSPSAPFSAQELLVIQQFVDSGGRLLVFADPTRSLLSYDFFMGTMSVLPDVNYLNPVLSPYGMAIVNDYLYNLKDNEGNFRNVKFSDFAENPLTAGLEMVVFYGAHSIRPGNGTPLIRSGRNTYSSLTDQPGTYAPLVLSENGRVLVAGDFSFLTHPFSQVADNASLLSAIAGFALEGERTPLLANFPYLFQRPVSLVLLGSLKMDTNLIKSIAMLQNALSMVNLPLQVREKPAEGNDVILLAALKDQEAIDGYIKPFGIALTEDEETGEILLTIKGFGKINAAKSGLLLFSTSAKTNTLVLLAPHARMLPLLVGLTASGQLSSCVVQGSIGICTLTLDESSSSDGDYDNYDDPYGG